MLPKRKTVLRGIFNKVHEFLNFHKSNNYSYILFYRWQKLFGLTILAMPVFS